DFNRDWLTRPALRAGAQARIQEHGKCLETEDRYRPRSAELLHDHPGVRATDRIAIRNRRHREVSISKSDWLSQTNNPAAAARCSRARAAGGSSRRSVGAILPECGARAARRFRPAP